MLLKYFTMRKECLHCNQLYSYLLYMNAVPHRLSLILVQAVHLFTQQMGHLLVLCFMESAESVIAVTIIAIGKGVIVMEPFNDTIMIQFPILKSIFSVQVYRLKKDFE